MCLLRRFGDSKVQKKPIPKRNVITENEKQLTEISGNLSGHKVTVTTFNCA